MEKRRHVSGKDRGKDILVLLAALTLTAIPLPCQEGAAELGDSDRKQARIAAAYAHLLTLVSPPGNHAPEDVAARNAKLFEAMEITAQQGEVLTSVASRYRTYSRLKNLQFGEGEPQPLPPMIAPRDQIRVEPMSVIDQIVVMKHMMDFQDRLDNLEAQLRVTGYCEREILPRIKVMYNEDHE